MHDVIRDMALYIAGAEEFILSHDKGLSEWPRQSYTCISATVTLGEAMPFPERMHCPGLKALFLTFDLYTTTPMLLDNFLNEMPDLTLLSIHGQHWSRERVLRFPLSFLSSSTKLRVLHLHRCILEDISLLGQVKDLEILRCHGSDIQVLPDEIRALRKLKLLDMTNCTKLKNIAPGVVSALVKLEELRLMGCPIEWERHETGDERRNASLAEVFSLKNLWFLEVWIKDLEVISQEMDYPPKLTSYSISIGREGDEYFWARSYTNLKRMSVCVDERRVFPDAISKLIEGVKELKLGGNGCKGIIESLGREGFENITSLKIDGLGGVKILVERPMDRVIFPNLKHLHLDGMDELEEICNGHPQVGSFSELKEISMRRCAKLKWVFPLSIAESLSKLESIRVSNCSVVEEVFKESESGITTVNHVKFPNLKKMELRSLPGLGAWCKAVDAIIEFPSIESLDISEVSSNFKIFGNMQLAAQVTCTKLKHSEMSNLDMEIFYCEVPNGFFFGVEQLEIISFNRLRVLFSLVVFKDLINLKKLIVKDCVVLKDIVEMEDEDEEHTNVTIKKLEELRLSKLPKIRYFWPSTYALKFPSLETVRITDCPMMEAFAADRCSSNMPSSSIPKFFGQQVTFTKLKELTMSHFSMEISPIGFFSGLETLHIESFHSLRILFSPAIVRALGNLRELNVENCMMLEYFVELEKDEDEGHRNNINKISQLQRLKLSKLPKIRYFGHFSNALEFPSLEKVTIEDCPRMETFVVDQLWSSNGMSSGSILARNFFNKQVTFTKLKELTMSHFSMEISPIGFFSGLETLHIESFHSLRILFSPAIFRALGNLRELNVENCMMLEYIVELEKDEDEGHRQNISKISQLQRLELSKLPKIRYFGHFSNALEFPSLEEVTIEDCPKMETFVVDQLWSSSSMSSGSIPARNFFNKQVTCPKLRYLRLDNCHNLKSLFTSRMSEGLTSLKDVSVTNCSLIEEVIAEDEDENENVDEMVVRIPELKFLNLEELPKLRWFFHTRRDFELPSLQDIYLIGCTEIMKSGSFCLVGGSVRIPIGVRVKGISDPEFASQFFFLSQHSQEEDSLDDSCVMLLPSYLSFTWNFDEDLSVVKGASNAFFLHGWEKACGKFDMEKLSPGITYEIAFVIMLLESRIDDVQLESMLADEKREHKVKYKPRPQWMEILVGELRLSSGQCGDITFSLQKEYSFIRVALKCAIIRPKTI